MRDDSHKIGDGEEEVALRREGSLKAGYGNTEEGASGAERGPKGPVGGSRWCRVAGLSAPSCSSSAPPLELKAFHRSVEFGNSFGIGR